MPDVMKIDLSLGPFQAQVLSRIEKLAEEGFSARLWRKDPTLWKDSSKDMIQGALGWLDVPLAMKREAGEIGRFATSVKEAGFNHAVLLGMGGSSLAPMVFSNTFGSMPGYPELLVLDSTDPEAVKRVERMTDPLKTLFIVASKSGTTIEPLSFFDYFHDIVSRHKAQSPGDNFIAITDPGTGLEGLSKRLGFRRVFLNPPDIGGRYSALSYFGIVPASMTGIYLEKLFEGVDEAVRACGPDVDGAENPGVLLGACLGVLAQAGRDKVTLVVSEGIEVLGLWIEQLLAESTGKEGKGLVPVTGEPLGAPVDYGPDRVFVRIGLRGDDEGLPELDALKDAGHPVLSMELDDKYRLGGEFFRWEVATAVAGSILGINPFDQPDVEDAKRRTRAYLEMMQAGEAPRALEASVEASKFTLSFAGPLRDAAAGAAAPEEALRRFTAFLEQGSYLAVLPYIDPWDEEFSGAVTSMRRFVKERFKVATQFGYGPRYLHSTGQLHKGGPPNGVFLIIIPSRDTGYDGVEIPGKGYTFRDLELAQAVGDMEALAARQRPVAVLGLRGTCSEELVESFKDFESLLETAVAG